MNHLYSMLIDFINQGCECLQISMPLFKDVTKRIFFLEYQDSRTSAQAVLQSRSQTEYSQSVVHAYKAWRNAPLCQKWYKYGTACILIVEGRCKHVCQHTYKRKASVSLRRLWPHQVPTKMKFFLYLSFCIGKTFLYFTSNSTGIKQCANCFFMITFSKDWIWVFCTLSIFWIK